VEKGKEAEGSVQKGPFPFLLPFDKEGEGRGDRPGGRPAWVLTGSPGHGDGQGMGQNEGATRPTYSVAYLGWGRSMEAALPWRSAGGGDAWGRRRSGA
jgi:hypothetical protein